MEHIGATWFASSNDGGIVLEKSGDGRESFSRSVEGCLGCGVVGEVLVLYVRVIRWSIS